MKRLGLWTLTSLIAIGVSCAEDETLPDPGSDDCVTDCWQDVEPFAPMGCTEEGVVMSGQIEQELVEIDEPLAARSAQLREEPRHVTSMSDTTQLYFTWTDLQTPRSTFDASGWLDIGSTSACFDAEFSLDFNGYDTFVLSNLRRREDGACTDEEIEGTIEGCAAVVVP